MPSKAIHLSFYCENVIYLFATAFIFSLFLILNVTSRFKVISYFKRRVVDVIRIIEKLDLINRTSELARLFGIQFFEVLSRGSQVGTKSYHNFLGEL